MIYQNGQMAGNNSNVALVLWYGGLVYQRNTGAGDFYVWAKSSQWLACSDPREQVCASSNGFYGINGHYDYPYRPDQVVSYLQALGATTYRVGTINTPEQLTPTVNLAQAFQAANLTLFVLVNYGLYKDGSLLPDETTAYNYVYEGAAAVAEALKPYGVTTYECGNELTRDSAIILDSTNAGTKGVDFNNANWPIMRGVMRGMIDGIKSVQPDAQCGINFCVADTGASDLLWDGLQPDGSGGYPKVRWDITTWHNYRIYGDIFNVGTDGAGPGFNLPVYVQARYGKPFMITEWNANEEDAQDFRASYITERLGAFYSARKQVNLLSVMYYELDSGNSVSWGLILDDGTPVNPPYTAFRDFTSAYPDTTSCPAAPPSTSSAASLASWMALLPF